MLGKEGFEVTTYRVDGEYEDCRHPKEVQFTKSLLEDLKRRDFTINAMAYNPAEGLIDEFDGAGDLKRGIIRCVGDAEARFGEDALRMMRAVRFGAQLGFELEEQTREAVKKLCENLRKVSAERIQTELVKMLVSPHPDRILEAWELGITGVMLPEFDACMACMQNNPHHMDTVGEHIANALQYVEPDKVLRLSMLLHDIGKPQTKTTDANGIDHFYGHAQVSEELTAKILRRLKFDNDTIRNVRRLVLHHDDRPATTSSSVRRAANRIGADLFPLYLNVCRADILAQTKETQESKLQNLSEIESIYEQILEKQQCFTLKQLAVTGRDLIAEGIPSGPRLGEILEKLLEEVLEEPEKNEREWLMSRALEIYQE
ncbi:MAG: HD domain-containing protein, partial [Candidatus Choladocola sp.]|nr:HD domain-containing protein [Candidatus Choladocola sp.]